MAEDPHETKIKDAPEKKTVTIKRVQIGVNVIIQVLVTIFIVGLVNYFSFRHYKRFDQTRDKKYVLSEQTKQVLGGLKKPVKAVVFFSTGSEVFGDVVTLLREYEYASKTKFQTEVVDPYRNFTRARALQDKYKFGANESVVILDYEGKSKFVNAGDMAEMDNSGLMMGQPPVLKAFKGEQAMTSALLELTEEKQSKVYVLTGHGEPEFTAATPVADPTPGPESMKALSTYIERQNIRTESLKLADIEKVPDDARALLIIAPKYDLSEREMTLLRDYWDRKGRLFVSLDTMHPLTRLNEFFEDNCIRPQDDRVLRTVALAGATGILREVSAVIKPGSVVTKRLGGVDTQFLGQTQSIYLDVQRAKPLGINLSSLIEAAGSYWGETENGGGEGAPVYFDTKKDHAAPLSLAVSVEKGALADKRVSVDTSRMVVVGNGDFLRDSALTESGLDFTLAGFNWLLNREELIAVAPKERKAFNLNLSDEQMARILLAVVFGVPGIVVIFGLLAWWQRRN